MLKRFPSGLIRRYWNKWKRLEQVETFTYLRAIIKEDCSLDEEINARLTKERLPLENEKHMEILDNISIRTKKKNGKCFLECNNIWMQKMDFEGKNRDFLNAPLCTLKGVSWRKRTTNKQVPNYEG